MDHVGGAHAGRVGISRPGPQTGDVAKGIHEVGEQPSFDQACAQHGAAAAMPIGTVHIHRPTFFPLAHGPF